MPSLEEARARLSELRTEVAELESLIAALTETSTEAAQPPPPEAADSLMLYAWQAEALRAWRSAGRRGVVQAVTGAGKTRVGLAAMVEALSDGRRVVVMVPTLDLVAQWRHNVEELVDPALVSTTMANGWSHRPWHVLIGTVQTLCRREAVAGDGALLIADECHRYGASEYARALQPSYSARLGLTATLERDDEGDALLEAFFGRVVFDLDYGRALADGIIAPYRIALVGVCLPPDEKSLYDELSETAWHASQRLVEHYGVPREPVAEFMATVGTMATVDGHPGQSTARLYLFAFAKRRKLLAETNAKQLALAALAPAVAAAQGTLVFTQTQDSARAAAETISSLGHEATAVFSGLDKSDRALRMTAFRERDVTLLAAPRILDEGIDVPEADLAIIVAANRSRRQMVQRLGRVLRLKSDGRPARLVVLYAVGTVEDPTASTSPDGFFELCLPHAEAVGRFALDRDGVAHLLAFLAGSAGKATRGPVATEAVDLSRLPEFARSLAEAGALTERRTARGGFILDPSDESDGPEQTVMTAGATADPVKDYLKQIGRVPLLSATEEVELAKRIEAGGVAAEMLRRGGSTIADPSELAWLVADGTAARAHFLEANLRLVVSLARRYTGRGLDFLDLVQEGNLGLMRALAKFDHRQGNKFSTYATWWIRQSLTRALADHGRTIRYPVHLVEQLNAVQRVQRALAADTGRPVPLPELAQHIDETHDDLRRLRDLPRVVAELGELADFERELDEALSDRLLVSIEDEVIGELDSSVLVHTVLDSLSERERFVLRRRFGFDDEEPCTLDTIGGMLGVTRERVRQIEAKALKRMVAMLPEGRNTWLI